MRAVEIARHGGPEVLTLVERPDPVPAAGEVLVRNQWIGVNYVDLQHRAGQPYPVVHFGHLRGVYAELTAVPSEFVVPLAPGVDLDDAAALAMNATTAYVLTSLATRIGPGDVVVVQAAAGATGGPWSSWPGRRAPR